MCCIQFGHIIRMENKWKWKCHSESFLFWLHLSKNSLEWLRKEDHQSNTIINKTTTCSKINTHSLSTKDTLTVFRFYLGCIFFSLFFFIFIFSFKNYQNTTLSNNSYWKLSMFTPAMHKYMRNFPNENRVRACVYVCVNDKEKQTDPF